MVVAPVIELRIDEDTLKKVQERLRAFPGALPIVIKRAIDRALAHIRSREAKIIAKDFQMTQTEARKHLFMRKANPFNLEGRARAGKVGWPLFLFSPQQTAPGVRPGGVTVRVGRSMMVWHAFIQRMPNSGHVGVFLKGTRDNPDAWAWKWVTNSRGQRVRHGLPIHEARTPTAAAAVIGSGATPELIQEAEEIVTQRLFEEVELIWSGKRGYAEHSR